jgi:proteasome lid subunit RPN8/RPN11
MITHCRRELPHEACGLLAGKGGRVAAILPMPNVAENPEQNYLVDGAAQVKAFRFMAEKGWELSGIYHSHPSSLSVPSRSDIAQAYYPEALYVIVGLRHPGKPDIRAYRLSRETEKAVRVRLESERTATVKTHAGRSFPAGSIGPLGWGQSHG